ncbi:hypothetical protein SDC9_136976 [bioreactor metagenome]|uniref:Uncharacterized protein n=1 Tax=bioreactor metagenome TaxID=1076179 RepID=A0A645DKT1_9ZZZZ
MKYVRERSALDKTCPSQPRINTNGKSKAEPNPLPLTEQLTDQVGWGESNEKASHKACNTLNASPLRQQCRGVCFSPRKLGFHEDLLGRLSFTSDRVQVGICGNALDPQGDGNLMRLPAYAAPFARQNSACQINTETTLLCPISN